MISINLLSYVYKNIVRILKDSMLNLKKLIETEKD